MPTPMYFTVYLIKNFKNMNQNPYTDIIIPKFILN